ncbi:MAG: SRPBCC family protein [Actinomycetota bacterium]|nr:SRPBCC family protein [Actinomycetota bacterium]
MRSPDLVVAGTVAAPVDAVWRVLAEPEAWPAWGPSVTAVDCPDARVRTGTRGRVRTVAGVWLPFTVVTVEPGRSWTWRIGPVRATGHRVAALGPERTRVEFTVPWWAAPYALVCRRAIARIGDHLAPGQVRAISLSS